MSGEVKIVPISEAPNEVIAEMWREVLADEGITAVVTASGPGFAFGSNALNVHTLLVREDQAEEARAVLAELERDEGGDEFVEVDVDEAE